MQTHGLAFHGATPKLWWALAQILEFLYAELQDPDGVSSPNQFGSKR